MCRWQWRTTIVSRSSARDDLRTSWARLKRKRPNGSGSPTFCSKTSPFVPRGFTGPFKLAEIGIETREKENSIKINGEDTEKWLFKRAVIERSWPINSRNIKRKLVTSRRDTRALTHPGGRERDETGSDVYSARHSREITGRLEADCDVNQSATELPRGSGLNCSFYGEKWMAIVRGVGCSKLNFLIAALVHRRNNVFEPREETKRKRVLDEWRETTVGRASTRRGSTTKSCQLHLLKITPRVRAARKWERRGWRDAVQQPIPRYDYANRMALALITWNTFKMQYIIVYSQFLILSSSDNLMDIW